MPLAIPEQNVNIPMPKARLQKLRSNFHLPSPKIFLLTGQNGFGMMDVFSGEKVFRKDLPCAESEFALHTYVMRAQRA